MDQSTPQEEAQESTVEQGDEMNNAPLSETVEDQLEADVSDSSKEDGDKVDSKEEVSTEEPANAEPSGETFYNAQNVPKELEPTFKKMQASFTKKMQDASSTQERAKLYDQTMENPKVRQALGLEAPSESATPVEEKYKGKTAHEIVQSMVKEGLETRFKEDIEPVISRSMQREADAEIATLQEKYPEDGELPSFNSLRDDIATRVEKHPEVAIEEHYKVLAFEQAQESAAQAVLKRQEVKKQASAETTGAPMSVTDAKPDFQNSEDSFWTAAKFALKKHGRG